MSDFTDGFWSLYVAGLTIVSILACALLLGSQSRKRGGDAQKVKQDLQMIFASLRRLQRSGVVL